MKWKKKNQPKQSISSVTSMSFLTDQNLTFHRFSDGTISSINQQPQQLPLYLDKDIKRRMSETSNYLPAPHNQPEIWTTSTKFDYSSNLDTLDETVGSTRKMLQSTPSTASEFKYLPSTPGSKSTMARSVSTNYTGGSTMKLISVTKDDQKNKQSRCSILRGVILCLCLNLTYANIVRFPRELERHGIAFLLPYLLLMFTIGLPIILLEISLGQFLGQGSAHTWRASPFFKGASIIGRFASWLASIYISMHAALSLLYIGKLSLNSVPFVQCSSTVKIENEQYREIPKSGQECLQDTFMIPVWTNSLYFGLLAISLIFLWMIIMLCSHSSKINRRSIFLFGFFALGLLVFQTGWEVSRAFADQSFPEMWPFRLSILADSSTWFYALVQVIFSTNIGVGAIPVISGKFLYKGDAVKTSFVYICFNLLIASIATAFYMMQFVRSSSTVNTPYPELTTLTAIYDRSLGESDKLLQRLIPSLSYLLVVLASLISISIFIYTSSRLLKRHPNYIMCLAGLFVSIGCLICPNMLVAEVLDMRVVGSIIICALIFDLISVAWIYGSKDLYTDLEFSIGRPIFKVWLVLWSVIPLALVGLLLWWILIIDPEYVPDYFPRWIVIVASLATIVLLACYEVSKQVDYNLLHMIQGAARPAKDWGPADPLVRHAWKQWKSVCVDTGERDFTLRRRGTKDYTHSIKKGQYSHANKYVNNNSSASTTKMPSTTGSNSPNYSGSVFGDSAIEEDMNSDKYPNQLDYQNDNRSSRKSSNTQQTNYSSNYKRHLSDASSHADHRSHYHSQKIPIRQSIRKDDTNYTSRVEITPKETPYLASSFSNKNPLTHPHFVASTPYNDHHQDIYIKTYGGSNPRYHDNGHLTYTGTLVTINGSIDNCNNDFSIQDFTDNGCTFGDTGGGDTGGGCSTGD